MRRGEKHDATDAIEEFALLRILPTISIGGEDELLDDEPAEAVAHENDWRITRRPQCAVGHQPVERRDRRLGDRPTGIPACLISGIAQRIDGEAFHVLGQPPRPEIAVVFTAFTTPSFDGVAAEAM